jgi:hypothetical protein
LWTTPHAAAADFDGQEIAAGLGGAGLADFPGEPAQRRPREAVLILLGGRLLAPLLA